MKHLIATAMALTALGCSNNPFGRAAEPDRSADSPPVAADNTAKNQPDERQAEPTAADQAENVGDREITQQVRQSVVKGDEISTSGKNVKIITVDGVVTLRGPVTTAREKRDIAALAKQVDGVKRVDNQLEIATK